MTHQSCVGRGTQWSTSSRKPSEHWSLSLAEVRHRPLTGSQV